ncbi:MAG: Gmad2 immunoglobulin-like domain-containing protein [Chloroflexota bacterium]|nr:Gmad2 immunoglobulin-like domain-containing protein [Chloroflexota bacterium]
MKTTEPRDDEILGRALSRAIETSEVNETPYERSRIAGRPARGSFALWPALGVAAALVLALAFGSWFTRPTDDGPVADSPGSTAAVSPGSTAPVATASASPTTAPAAQIRVFFVRDLLPPVSALINGRLNEVSRESRIDSRITAMRGAPATSVPSGASNPISLIAPRGATGSSSLGLQVTVNGDVATVEFDVTTGWGVRGSAQSLALLQQLVYVITEEPGIRRARILDMGKNNAVIDGLVVDQALSREDVTDYDTLGSTKPALGYGDANAAAARKLTTRTSVETIAPGLARIEIESDLQNISPTVSYPDFKVEVFENDETAKPLGGKWRMVVTVNGTDTVTGTQTINKSPLRSIVATSPKGLGTPETVYEIGLDDLRPWRTAIAFNPFRIIIDIGGDPRTIFDSNAVNSPAYGATVGATFQVSGVAHNFEAHVDIIVRDDREKEILRTSTTGTNCCDPGGTFTATVRLPAGTTGKIYLEVYEGSARDGSVTKLIRIPLTVR